MHPAIAAGKVVGRDEELALLNGYLVELIRGHGNAVLVEGEPGIGKTALVRAALARLPAGAGQVLWGTGDELSQEMPLSPFLDALGVRRSPAGARRAVIAGLLRGEVAADRGADVPAMLAEQLIALIADETLAQRAVLVIDDLQWADPASVQLWDRLARLPGQGAVRPPLLLIGLCRPAPQRADLTALRRAVGTAARVRLGALGQPAVQDLVGALAGGRPDAGLLRLAAGAAGNPLYLTELMAALNRAGSITVTAAGAARTARLADGAVPGSLTAAIASRIDFLSPPARQALQAAALLGTEFDVRDLVTVLGVSTAAVMPALTEACETGVLADPGSGGGGGGGLAFRHPLIREALYAELPAGVRGALHRDAARALAGAGAATDRVARQLLRSAGGGTGVGRADEWMLEWLVASADALLSQAPGVAAGLLAHATADLPGGTFRHAWLASRLADARYRTGDIAEAERVALRALSHGTAPGGAPAADPDLVTDLHWTLAQCRMWPGAARESLVTLEKALGSPGCAGKHRGRLLALAARTRLLLRDFGAAEGAAHQAFASAEGAGDAPAAAWALHVLAHVALARDDPAAALRLHERALAVTETDAALTDLGLLLQVNQAVLLLGTGRCDEALATAQRALHRADQAGTSVRLAQAHSVLGQVLHQTGRWDDALTEVAAMPGDLKEPLAACYDAGIAAEISLHRDAPEPARRYLADAQRRAEQVSQWTIPLIVRAAALEREHAGAPGEALAVLTAALDANADSLGEIEELLSDAVRLAVMTGDHGTARARAAQAAALATDTGAAFPPRQASALYCQGLADQDADKLLAAAELHARAGRPLPRARALEAAAERLLTPGSTAPGNAAGAGDEDRARARKAFEQAAAIYESLGAEADLNRVRARFRAYGIRRGPHSKHRRAVSGWESLTETELKVAAFIAEGLTNPEIADRLVVGRRTVATHVSHTLEKLRAATRAEIAREFTLHREQAPAGPPGPSVAAAPATALTIAG